MPDDKKRFELGDYVEVKDRIKLFYELYGQGRLVTSKVKMLTAPDGTQRVMVTAKAYRTADDPLPGIGTSWLQIPGSTPYTRGSEVENAETSAWGRAIGSLGILIDKSIASGNEIRNKEQPATVNGGPPPEHPPLIPPNVETETLIGTPPRQTGTVRRLAQRTPLEGREGPDGHAIVFKLEIGDRPSFEVVVKGDAGEKLWLACSMKPDALVGHSISVKGRLYNVTQPNRPSKYRLHVMEWSTDDYEYPAPPTGPEPPDSVSLVGEHEAPTAPLFDDVAVAT